MEGLFVIGDNSVKNFSGSINSLDANGDEVFSLLVSCRELWKLGGYNAISGGSFSTIQWGSGKSSSPSRLADWVKDMQDISSQLNVTFNLLLREANDMADDLAREGVSIKHFF